jgi:uncharacterized membrane protein YphA (DoxX/SURF4 family)
VQRLFSTFPGSWPGFGLLILRITVGVVPFDAIMEALARFDAHAGWIALSILGLLAGCVVLGLVTPVVAPLFVVGALVISRTKEWPEWLAIAGGGLSLMMLGPGAWSLDAWLFGRKRIDLDRE